MWTSDDFPGADKVPWQLLIRARYLHQIDAVVASAVVQQVSRCASVEITEQVVRAATEGVSQSSREEASSEQRISALSSAMDFVDICPPNWPFRWPPRPKGRFEELSDPIAHVVLEGALEFVRAAGSDRLNKTLGETLHEVGQLQR